MENLEHWHQRLMTLAKSRKLGWLISEDHEAHREAFEDGDTIEMELDHQMASAQDGI